MTMTISRDEAAQALGEIEAARSRFWQAKSYGYAAPFLIIWGLVWMVADLTLQFEPTWGLAWPVAASLGTVASLVAGVSLPRPKADRARGWRNLGATLVVAGFFVALLNVIPITSGAEVHSIFGLVFGFLYMGAGLWLGWRLFALGAALAVLTLIGFFAVHEWYALYMGLVSGGALVLGGLWLRKL
jgi:hypothetical protein